MGTGRPTDYNLEYCEKVIEWMSQGNSFESFCAEVCNVTKVTGYEWQQVHPEFKEACLKAKQLCEQWWIKKAQDNLLVDKGQSFNSAVWIFFMKCRFGWREEAKDDRQPVNLVINAIKPDEKPE